MRTARRACGKCLQRAAGLEHTREVGRAAPAPGRARAAQWLTVARARGTSSQCPPVPKIPEIDNPKESIPTHFPSLTAADQINLLLRILLAQAAKARPNTRAGLHAASTFSLLRPWLLPPRFPGAHSTCSFSRAPSTASNAELQTPPEPR